MLRFDIITLFPKMFESVFAESIVSRAQKNQLIDIQTHQLRDWATDKHHTTDDTPYGGGPGMVLKVTVVDKALRQVIPSDDDCSAEESKDLNAKGTRHYGGNPKKTRIVMLSASGERFTQQKAIELSKYQNIILLCGHYEGFDYRVHEHLIDEEISIGDYVLTGGEIPAMVIIDAVSRMIPGVIKEESIINESFMNPTSDSGNPKAEYDYPVYTRPVEYRGWRVPEVLQNGNLAEIDKWRESNRKKQTPGPSS